MAAKKFKVKYKNFDKKGIWGEAHIGMDRLDLDSGIRGLKHLEIMCHEMQHLISPDMSEKEVTIFGAMMARTLWAEGYRRQDNDTTHALQDEKQ